MKRIDVAIRAGLATLAFAAAAPAFAQAQSSAYLEQIGYELHDLDVCDGITPSITFLDSWDVEALLILPDGIKESETLGTISTANANGSAAATIGPALAQASALAYHDSASASASNRHYFTLSANTSVTFYATGSLSLSNAAGDLVYSDAYLQSSAGTEIGTFDSASLYTPGVDAYADYRDIRLTSTAGGLQGATQGWVALAAQVGASSIAPVPEPGMPALLLGGLPLLAVAGRWQARHRTWRPFA